MTVHLFAGQSADNAAMALFTELVNATSIDSIPEKSFNAVRALDAGLRSEVASAFEKLLVTAVMRTAFHESQKPMRAMDALEVAAIESAPANRAITEGIYRGLVMVADIKGDEAQLMTRAYIQEVARLPAEEAGTVRGYTEAAARAWSHVVAVEYPDDESKTVN
jgi:hypothetical protein